MCCLIAFCFFPKPLSAASCGPLSSPSPRLPQHVGSVTGPEMRLFHSAHYIDDVTLPPSGKLTQEALLLLLMFSWSATRAGKWSDEAALVCSHIAPCAAVTKEPSHLEWRQVDFWIFISGLLLHPSVVIALSHPVLEFQRIGDICVSTIDFMIFAFIPSCWWFSAAISIWVSADHVMFATVATCKASTPCFHGQLREPG